MGLDPLPTGSWTRPATSHTGRPQVPPESASTWPSLVGLKVQARLYIRQMWSTHREMPLAQLMDEIYPIQALLKTGTLPLVQATCNACLFCRVQALKSIHWYILDCSAGC